MVIAGYLRECGYKVVEGEAADDIVAVSEAGTKIDVILTEVQLTGLMILDFSVRSAKSS